MKNEKKVRASNLLWHKSSITRELRQSVNQHKSMILWFTGLSGSGKSTLAHAVEKNLFEFGCSTFVFDGDNVRHGLCGDLGFSDIDRVENIRRIGEMTNLFIQAGVISLTAFISPVKNERNKVRESVADEDFIEIYCKCSLSVCESRDVKGFYKRARAGEIQQFTGISSPYEEPISPELVIETDNINLDESVDIIITYLVKNKYIK